MNSPKANRMERDTVSQKKLAEVSKRKMARK